MDVTLSEVSLLMLHDHKVFTKFKDADSALQYLSDEVCKNQYIPAVGMVRGKEVNFRAAGKPDGKLTTKFSLASWDATNSIWQNWDRALRVFFHEKASSNHKTAYELLFKNERTWAVPVRSLGKMVKDRGLIARKASSKTTMQTMDQRATMISPQLLPIAQGCSKDMAKKLLAQIDLVKAELEARLATPKKSKK